MKLHIQGDVALRTTNLPEGATKTSKRPLALGESSGHAHVIKATEQNPDNWDLFEFEGRLFVVTRHDGAQLRHVRLKTGEQADHLPIALEPNQCYEVILQNEYNPESAAFERVID